MGGLLVLFILLQAVLWGRHGLPDLWELRRLNLSSEIKNNELMGRNHVLKQEISDMKSGFEAIEKEAREELGMVKRGETFFRVIERVSPESAPPQPAP